MEYVFFWDLSEDDFPLEIKKKKNGYYYIETDDGYTVIYDSCSAKLGGIQSKVIAKDITKFLTKNLKK